MKSIIEIDRRDVAACKGAVNAYKQGLYTEWTEERIKGAFNFGRGTLDDFARYRRDNKCFALWYIVLDDGERLTEL